MNELKKAWDNRIIESLKERGWGNNNNVRIDIKTGELKKLNRFADCVDIWETLTDAEKEYWKIRDTKPQVKGMLLFMGVCQLQRVVD